MAIGSEAICTVNACARRNGVQVTAHLGQFIGGAVHCGSGHGVFLAFFLFWANNQSIKPSVKKAKSSMTCPHFTYSW